MLQICKFPGLTWVLKVQQLTWVLKVQQSVQETYKFVTLLQICNISTNL
jgi:hypothetical protein